MEEPVKVETRVRGRHATVALVGELDERDVHRIESELLALAGSGVSEILLDLDGLTFMDSTGIALLIRLERDARRRGHRFALLRPSEGVRARLDRTGLLSLLNIAEEDPGRVGAGEDPERTTP
jgi:anti-sigma B factor antagonist